MHELGLLTSVLVCAGAGTSVGFVAGLVPGLHMNNIAAALTAYGVGVLGLLAMLGGYLGSVQTAVLAACLISAALISHLFASAITSTYVGIPSEDVVSVLPAHRLAKAGHGRTAVTASADGSLAGVVLSVMVFMPVCILMGPWIGLYSLIHKAMIGFIVFFSIVLLVSEGARSHGRSAHLERLRSVLRALIVFLCSGVLGTIVLRTDYYACPLPDFPWMPAGFVPKSSLLLPMFAGLFGISGLLLSLGSRCVSDSLSSGVIAHHVPSPRDMLTSLLGGLVVGWMPGMTSGSAVTLCSPRTHESEAESMGGAVRFIWLYSAISSSGAVFAVGALFTILRARSGSMDAVEFFIGREQVAQGILPNSSYVISMVLSMLLASIVSYSALRWLSPRLAPLRAVLCSRRLAITSMTFVCVLSLALTGVRGLLLLVTATSLGMIPPLSGVRRIQLMGCLLVPIAITYLAGA